MPASTLQTETALPLVSLQAKVIMPEMGYESDTRLEMPNHGRLVPVRMGAFRCILFAIFTLLLSSVRAVPVPVRTLWPDAVEPSPTPTKVSIAQTTNVRNSAIFAIVVAFSAAVRLISSEMPVLNQGRWNVAAFLLVAILPSILAPAMSLSVSNERRFSWVWGHAVMIVAVFGAVLPLVLLPRESHDENGPVKERVHLTPLRAIPYQLAKPRILRIPIAALLFIFVVAALVNMEAWDVLSLSFAAFVLIGLGLEPKLRTVSPFFNNVPAGFPPFLVVRSLEDGEPLPIIYYISDTHFPRFLFEYSAYPNTALGKRDKPNNLAGLIGDSIMEHVKSQRQTGEANVDPALKLSASLRSLWPWLSVAEFKDLMHDQRTISVFLVRRDIERPSPLVNVGQKLDAVRFCTSAKIPFKSFETGLAIAAMESGNGLHHFHIMQLWSQWIETHKQYATSLLGYNDNLGSDEDFDEEETHKLVDEACLNPMFVTDPRDADFNIMLSAEVYCGASPELNSIALQLNADEEEMLAERYKNSILAGSAAGGDWLTRVIDAQLISDIAGTQEEWAELLGFPIGNAAEIIEDEKMAELISERCCEVGLIVPGPSYCLLEAFLDRVVLDSTELSSAEAAAVACLARFSFHLVEWGAFGKVVVDNDKRKQLRSGTLPVQFVGKGELQKMVLKTFVSAPATSCLYSELVVQSLERFKGINDNNDLELNAFPLRQNTASRVISEQVFPNSSRKQDSVKQESGHIRSAELKLIAPERFAILQLGVASFFGIAALLRSL